MQDTEHCESYLCIFCNFCIVCTEKRRWIAKRSLVAAAFKTGTVCWSLSTSLGSAFCMTLSSSFLPAVMYNIQKPCPPHVWTMHAMFGEFHWNNYLQQSRFKDPAPQHSVLLLPVFSLLKSVSILLPFLSSTVIIMVTDLISLTVCLHASFGLAALVFPFKFTPVMSKPVVQELTDTSIPSSLRQVWYSRASFYLASLLDVFKSNVKKPLRLFLMMLLGLHF